MAVFSGGQASVPQGAFPGLLTPHTPDPPCSTRRSRTATTSWCRWRACWGASSPTWATSAARSGRCRSSPAPWACASRTGAPCRSARHLVASVLHFFSRREPCRGRAGGMEAHQALCCSLQCHPLLLQPACLVSCAQSASTPPDLLLALLVALAWHSWPCSYILRCPSCRSGWRLSSSMCPSRRSSSLALSRQAAGGCRGAVRWHCIRFAVALHIRTAGSVTKFDSLPSLGSSVLLCAAS